MINVKITFSNTHIFRTIFIKQKKINKFIFLIRNIKYLNNQSYEALKIMFHKKLLTQFMKNYILFYISSVN